MIGERLRNWRRIAAFGAFGLAVYLISFYLAFPYQRVKELVVSSAALAGLDVEIAEAGPGFGIGMAMSNVTVKTRPTDGGKPTQLLIDEAFLSFAPLARLAGDEAFGLIGETLGGDVALDVRVAPKNAQFNVAARDLQMKQMPGIKDALGLPLAGVLTLDADLAQPNRRLSEANGSFDWNCAGCAVGDGKAKLKVASNPLLAEGITFPRVRLGDFIGKIVFEKGTGRLQGVRARSPDGELIAEGEVRLSDTAAYSSVDLYIRFKLSEALVKSDDKLQLMMQLAESMGKRPDGYYGFRLSGPLSRPSSLTWMKSSPFEGRSAPGSGTRRAGFGRTFGGEPAVRAPSSADPP